jgi:hypothetical protein
MTPIWLYEIPLWLLGAMVIGLSVLYTVAGVLALRRWVHALPRPENETAGYLLSIAGVAYAVLLAMIAVGAWNGVSEVEGSVEKEGNALAAMYREVGAYGPADAARFHRLIADYSRFVVEDEWVALRRGRRSPRTEIASHELSSGLTAYEPAAGAAQLVHPQVLEQVSAFTEARRMRLLTGTRGLDGVTWFVVVLGGLITISFSFFFHTRTLSVHLMLSALASGMLGLLIFLILAMDHPLWGDMSVSPQPFEDIVRQSHEASPAPAGLALTHP